MTVRDVLVAVEQFAPPHFAFGFDKIGLQTGNPDAEVTQLAVSLDSGLGAIRFAADQGAQVLVAHHPLVWEPLKAVRTDDWNQRRVFEAVKSGISVIAAHTNWDCAPGGINDTLAGLIGLHDVRTFGSAERETTWKIVVYVPVDSGETMIDALSSAGAGAIGQYRRCAFTTEGTGTFCGGEGSKPVVGKPGQIERVPEVKIEMTVPGNRKPAVEKALRTAHPYEAPAFDWVPLADSVGYPAGRIGRLDPKNDFQQHTDHCLQSRSEIWLGHNRPVETVAVVGGAAAGEWKAALAAGADAFVTGEVPQHIALEASESGLTILACGHYATEQPGMAAMAKNLRESLRIPIHLYAPQSGFHGHPL